MTQKRKVTLAVSLMVTAVSLAGCGGGVGVQPTDQAATQSFAAAPVNQTAGNGPVYRNNSLQVFAAKGSQQIVVKTRPGSVLAAKPHMRTVRNIQPLQAQVIALDAGQSVEDAIRQLKADPSVVYAEPNYTVRAFDTVDGSDAKPRPYPSVTPPNDPKFGDQYGPQLIHAPAAWTKTKGTNVIIAIVDTGIDVTHPEFAGKIVPGYAASDAEPTLTPSEKDDNGHGTHCAGISAAIANNGEGVAGTAIDAKLMPVKVLSAEGSGSDAGVAEGIVWAADHGANVISMSLGGPGDSQVLDDAVKHALEKGVAVVAAMGNDGDGSKSYPAAIPGVIAVGAVDKAGKVANFSQFGTWISVSAPGVSILSTFPTYTVNLNQFGFPQNYATLDGTSMATPYVSGVAALVKAVNPGMKPADVKKKIETTANKHNNKYDIHYGWGIVDAYYAVK